MENSNKNALLWLSRAIGKKKFYIVFLLGLHMILGFIGVAYAIMLRGGIDRAVEKDTNGFIHFFIGFASLVILQIVCQAISRFMQEYARSGFENCFKERLFDALLQRNYGAVTRTHSGEWMNRLTSDTVVVAEGLTTILPGVARLFVKLVGALIAILLMEPKFGIVLIPGGILMLFFSYAFRRRLKKLHKQMQESDGKVRVFLQEHLGSLMVVKSFVREKDTKKEAVERMEEHRKARMKKNHFSNVCNIGFGAAMNGIYALGVGYGGYGILTGSISYGTFLAITQLISQIQTPFANMTGYFPKFYAMLASAERLMEVETYEKDGSVEDAKEHLESQLLTLEKVKELYNDNFCNIGFKAAIFSYSKEGEPVLKNVDLELKKGEYIAFTGASGCGKSTVMKLLMSLYSLDAGEQYITLVGEEGENERRALTSQYRRLFSYVPQGNHLMSGTIREVVAFSDSRRKEDEEAIYQALEIACAKGFVSELPEGIDTLLGERGAGLSEGQMQRIAIARAVFSDNPILLLDEATSALDEDTETKLLENLRAMTNKMVLIVTHRPAALEICDRIIMCTEKGWSEKTDR